MHIPTSTVSIRRIKTRRVYRRRRVPRKRRSVWTISNNTHTVSASQSIALLLQHLTSHKSTLLCSTKAARYSTVSPPNSTMPYPILTLPYPFAKRLPQLLSPVELQNLQIAAGNFESPLKPAILTRTTRWTYFEGDTSDFITLNNLQVPNFKQFKFNANNEIVKIADNKLIYNCRYAMFHSLSKAVFENSHFNNINYAAKGILFDNCILNAKFLKKFAKKIDLSKCEYLNFLETNVLYESIKFSTILKIFPNVKKLELFKAYYGWMRDLADANTATQLQFLRISSENLEELLSFDSSDFHHLLRKHPRIEMEILYHAYEDILLLSPEYFLNRIKTALGLRSRKEYYADVYFSFEVGFKNGDEWEYIWEWQKYDLY